MQVEFCEDCGSLLSFGKCNKFECVPQVPNKYCADCKYMISPKYQCVCPGLEYIPNVLTNAVVFDECEFEAYFNWPSINEDPTWSNGASLVSNEWPEIGVLSTVGYRVGVNGIQDDNDRRDILLRVFISPVLPFVGDVKHMREWGPANSSWRLRKIAQSICSFANLNQKKTGTEIAVMHWKDDLLFLKMEIYDKMFPNEQSWPILEI